MLSLANLLNPVPSGPPPPPPPPAAGASRAPANPLSMSPATPLTGEAFMLEKHLPAKHTMAKDSVLAFTKSKPKGIVHFLPFEDLNEESAREVQRYQVYPMGSIQEFCRRIPYNSGKKDFFEKTGRESFEVFQYIFRVPEDSSDYTVMWDYNVGLVRMTPFFKCCKYSKTMPAKMLNQNPGLRDITHSITGGAIVAQGYWMPFACAKAVCATFCANIAGAMIPIFGPDFPSQCISPDAPEYGRMIIDPAVIAESAREAEIFRRMYTASSREAVASSSKAGDRQLPPISPLYTHPNDGLPHFRKGMVLDSPYGTDTEGDGHSGPNTPMFGTRYVLSPAIAPLQGMAGRLGGPTPSCSPPGWQIVHHLQQPQTTPLYPFHHQRPWRDEGYPGPAEGPDPWLSVVPRLVSFSNQHHGAQQQQPRLPSVQIRQAAQPRQTALYSSPPTAKASRHRAHSQLPHQSPPSDPRLQTQGRWRAKRPIDQVAPAGPADSEYDASESGSSPATTASTAVGASNVIVIGDGGGDGGNGSKDSRTSSTSTNNTHNTDTSGPGGAEKNAALMLMHLSVRDCEREGVAGDDGAEQAKRASGGGLPGLAACPPAWEREVERAGATVHRNKRLRRASSY